jgi:hypothetical protein
MLVTCSLLGCGSTPYTDDYAKHINVVPKNHYNDDNFRFSFTSNTSVDLRGIYVSDDTANASPMVYFGGAGIVGMLAQIGTHSSIVNSQRNERLAFQQQEANTPILPLIDLANELPLNQLVGQYHSELVNDTPLDSDILTVKPIFFSNKEMTRLSLKSIVSLPITKTKKTRKKQKFKYQNMIQVYAPKIEKTQSNDLLSKETDILSKTLASLLQTALHIAKSDLTGKFNTKHSEVKTFIIEEANKKKVIRGTLIAEQCGYQIIKDLHSWFIATPSDSEPENTEKCDYI